MIRRRRRAGAQEEINIAPLIDMMFILLIFFVVTARFTKDTSIQIDRPSAATAHVQEGRNIVVAVDRHDQVYIDNERIEVSTMRGMLHRALQSDSSSGVVVVADKSTSSGMLLKVYDECRQSGAHHVSVATQKTP